MRKENNIQLQNCIQITQSDFRYLIIPQVSSLVLKPGMKGVRPKCIQTYLQTYDPGKKRVSIYFSQANLSLSLSRTQRVSWWGGWESGNSKNNYMLDLSRSFLSPHFAAPDPNRSPCGSECWWERTAWSRQRPPGCSRWPPQLQRLLFSQSSPTRDILPNWVNALLRHSQSKSELPKGGAGTEVLDVS